MAFLKGGVRDDFRQNVRLVVEQSGECDPIRAVGAYLRNEHDLVKTVVDLRMRSLSRGMHRLQKAVRTRRLVASLAHAGVVVASTMLLACASSPERRT